jgi:5-carboxymethyl-2-hydroxymuconate isomerase
MPHLRIEAPEEWLREDFIAATGFDVRKLLDHLVGVVTSLRMENPKGGDPPTVPFINLTNLKHAIVPVHYAHVAGDKAKRFLHITMAAGNDTAGRTAEVRRRVAQALGDEADRFIAEIGDVKGLASVTVHVKDIDRDRGYSTTAERKKRRDADL